MSDDVQGGPAGPADAAPNADEPASMVDERKRGPMLIGLVTAIVVIGIVYFLYDYFIGSRSVSTDNAYVAGETAIVTPLVSGKVVEVLVSDTQPVRRGQVLFRLDDADQRIAVAQAEAQLEYARRYFGQAVANSGALGAAADAGATQIGAAAARVESAQAGLAKAQADYSRRAALSGSGAVSGEELTAAREALASAQAAAREARAGLAAARSNAVSARRQEDAARAMTRGVDLATAPQVLLARAQLETARLNLLRTVIRAPIDGVIAKRTIQSGQRLESGFAAMTIVPVDRLYVDANFKEDQLGKVRSGQAVTLTSDFYGDDVEFHGKVVGLGGGTGAAFSLIPAQNATGNWIKVVQRLPVRIALDPRELREHPLRIGLSMEATIDLASGD
jgi:membrane fusion protein (multidrug efflux system)